LNRTAIPERSSITTASSAISPRTSFNGINKLNVFDLFLKTWNLYWFSRFYFRQHRLVQGSSCRRHWRRWRKILWSQISRSTLSNNPSPQTIFILFNVYYQGIGKYVPSSLILYIWSSVALIQICISHITYSKFSLN
jgi:hypothetical protein